MSQPATIVPTPPARSRAAPWWGLLQVVWSPGSALGRALEHRWVFPPYLVGTALSLLVWYLVIQVMPGLQAAGDELAPGAVPMGPAGPGVRFGPMGPGPQPLPVEQLKAALRPEFLAVAALVAPWFGGLWRGLLLHVGGALTGERRPFGRAFGLAGYSMLPLWVGQALAAVLAVVLLATQPPGASPAGGENGRFPGAEGPMPAGMAMAPGRAGPMPGGGMPFAGPGGAPGAGGAVGDRPTFSTTPVRWTLDRLAPNLEPGVVQRLLAGLEFFHLWSLLLLSLSLGVLTRRWAPPVFLAAGFLVTWSLLAFLQPQMPQILTWIGLLR